MKRHYTLTVLLVLAAILLVLPIIFRATIGEPIIPGAGSYEEFLRAPGVANLYGYILSSLGTWSIVLSVLFGLLSAFLVHLLARKHFRSLAARAAIPLLFVMNPLFISLFTGLSPATLAIPLGLFALLEKRWCTPIASVFLAIISPEIALLFFTPFVLFHKRRCLLLPLVVAIGFLVLQGVGHHPFSLSVVEFGATPGISIFFVSLGLIESFLQWNKEGKRLLVAWWFLVLALTPFNSNAVLVGGLGATLFVALFIERLLKRKWQLDETRTFAFLLIACSFLFLVLAQVMLTANQAPSRELVEILDVAEGTVLVLPEHEAFVRFFSRAEPIHCPECSAIYYVWRLDDAVTLLNATGISEIMVTEEMQDGVIWNRDEEGLLFLLEHSDRFFLAAKSGAYELWRYVPQKPLKESLELSTA